MTRVTLRYLGQRQVVAVVLPPSLNGAEVRIQSHPNNGNKNAKDVPSRERIMQKGVPKSKNKACFEMA